MICAGYLFAFGESQNQPQNDLNHSPEEYHLLDEVENDDLYIPDRYSDENQDYLIKYCFFQKGKPCLKKRKCRKSA